MSDSPNAEWRDPVVEIYKRHVDRSLLRQALRLTPEQRLVELQRLVEFAEELRRAGKEAKQLV